MKKEQKTEITRKRIMEAAIYEFGENGYQGASINHICNTGIPKGLIYHNFKNRDDLYLACVAECYHDLLHTLQNADIEYNLQEYLSVRFRFFTEKPQKASIIMESMMYVPQNLKRLIQEIKGEFDRFNYEFFHNMLCNIKVRKNITEEEAMKYFSFVQILFHSYMEGEGLEQNQRPNTSSMVLKHEEILSKIMDLILYGIAERGNESWN